MRPGEILKRRYRLVRPLAADPRAGVWTARDEVLDRTVLVKFLHIAPGDSEARERFRREALGVARLSHPGIVAVYDTILEEGTAALVLEHVQATPLSRFLHEGGSVSPHEAVSIALQVADALEAAHNSGVGHRNLSPDSVWLCSDQRVKITDFGTAWQPGSDAAAEQALPDPHERSDLRALARLLQSCLAAAGPDEPIPEPLTEFVELALTPEQQAGFASVAEARAQLADAHDPSPQPDAPWTEFPAPLIEPVDRTPWQEPPPAGRRRRRRGGPVVVVVTIVAVALLIALLTGDDEPSAVTVLPLAPAVVVDSSPAPAVDQPPGSPAPAGSDRTAEPAAGPPASPPAPGGEATDDEFSNAGAGVAITAVAVTTFRRNPPLGEDADALRTLDGDESTYWVTPGLGAGDATVDGVGLEFRLAEATALAQMAVVSDTDGWAAAVYLGEGGYSQLSDWGLLVDQRTNAAGRMLLDLGGEASESVLLWIPDPRAAVTDEIRIAEVVISAAPDAPVR